MEQYLVYWDIVISVGTFSIIVIHKLHIVNWAVLSQLWGIAVRVKCVCMQYIYGNIQHYSYSYIVHTTVSSNVWTLR